MKFTINIPVTRKRTKHGYYLVNGTVRQLFIEKKKAIRAMRNDLNHFFRDARIVTVRDYAKTAKSKPPVSSRQMAT